METTHFGTALPMLTLLSWDGLPLESRSIATLPSGDLMEKHGFLLVNGWHKTNLNLPSISNQT